MSEHLVIERLVADGFVRRVSDRSLPADRWHAAVARAATELLLRGEELEDLRVPVAWALADSYGNSTSDDELVEMVAVMVPLTGVGLRSL